MRNRKQYIKTMNQKYISLFEKFTVWTTNWVGSVQSLIIHSIIFIFSFSLYFFGVKFENILSVLTNIVSLEAIYLTILVQMSINFQSKKLHIVAESVEEMQEDVEDIQENMEDIQENMEDIQENVEEIQKDVEEINDDEEEDEDITKLKESVNKLMKEFVDLKRQYKKQQNEKS